MSRFAAAVLVGAWASLLAAGCYDSNQSRPRSTTSVRTRQTDYPTNDPSNTNADTSRMPPDKGFHGDNPKTGKP